MQLQEVVLEGRACGLDVYQDEGQDGSGGQQEGQQEVQLQQVVLQRCACGVYQGVDEAKDQSDAE